jgi:hypothetical protein
MVLIKLKSLDGNRLLFAFKMMNHRVCFTGHECTPMLQAKTGQQVPPSTSLNSWFCLQGNEIRCRSYASLIDLSYSKEACSPSIILLSVVVMLSRQKVAECDLPQFMVPGFELVLQAVVLAQMVV